jgi:hypothetical protein
MPHDDFFRRELETELPRVENLMRRKSSFEKKVYYFSAAYDITSRTFRYSFSKEILLADFVLQGACNLLADRIESREKVQDALEAILGAAYVTTGPGNYLREKEEIKL